MLISVLSRILPTCLAFISGYANTENVFYCLNINNRLRPHPRKSEVTLLTTGYQWGFSLRCTWKTQCHDWLPRRTKLLSLIVDQILTWIANLLDAKKSLAKTMDLLKRSHFLPRGILKNFYFKVIFQLLSMAFRCGQNIQIAKCYSKSKILVEIYKI